MQNSHGRKTLFVKTEAKAFDTAEQAASNHARLASEKAAHAGEIFYKWGVKEAAFRHVTTGHIVVRFVSGKRIDPETFAASNGLEFRRRIGIDGSSVVFVNKSDRNDIDQSNSLMQNPDVASAEPDWVLPVRLY
ncbi:hypothetical protein [Sulfurimonas diazotrophicus]|uniref:Uncharacterized protein n=1 Tax=Sulfurimonas diazotrophicus TaxID=3131939 RepID=A0ABZ3H878_9BACT